MPRFDISDFEWRFIKPVLPRKSWGVPRLDAVVDADNGDVVMIDGTSVREHHSAVTLKNHPDQCMGRRAPG